MARRKRASMREGPLADLFRSTVDDPPADPPEAPGELARGEKPEPGSADAPTEHLPAEESREGYEPRFGRQDPAERARERAETPKPDPGPDPSPPTPKPDPTPPSPEPDPAPPQISADDPLAPPSRGADTSTVPAPKERLSQRPKPLHRLPLG